MIASGPATWPARSRRYLSITSTLLRDSPNTMLGTRASIRSPASATACFNDEARNCRVSSMKHAVALAGDLIEARVPSIVFGESRNSVEVMLKYLRERAGHVAGPEAIMAYRG